MRLIAADIGGTGSRLAVLEGGSAAGLVQVGAGRYASADWPDFETLYQRFLDEQGIAGNRVDLLLLALPGVIHDGRARLTNLDWVVDRDRLRGAFAVERVVFINDFQAAAHGVSMLDDGDRLHLNDAALQPDRPMVITGAGTGLGMAWQVPGSEPLVTEGGHMDFAPLDATQSRLLEFLRRRFPEHVSYERILSGAGLLLLHEFLAGPDDKPMKDARDVTGAAVIGGEDLASRAVQLFVRVLAAYAGNLALALQPFGGLYIAGGIAPKLCQWLNTDEFMEYYSAKGRMSDLVARIPLILVLNENLGLAGAVERGRRILGSDDNE